MEIKLAFAGVLIVAVLVGLFVTDIHAQWGSSIGGEPDPTGDPIYPQWSETRHEDTETGEVTITRTSISNPDRVTEDLVIKKTIRYNEKTDTYKEETSTTYPDGSGHSETVEGSYSNPTDRRKTSETDTKADGSSRKTTYAPSDGHITSRTVSDGKGDAKKYTYNANGDITSWEHKSSDGSTHSITYDPNSCSPGMREKMALHGSDPLDCYNKKSETVKGADGTVTKTSYGPNNKPISKSRTDGKTGQTTKYTCLASGECYDSFRAAPKGGFEGATKKPPFETGLRRDFTASKQKIKDEVLGQIEAKPRGDLTRSNEKTHSGMVEQYKGKARIQDITVGRKENLGVMPRTRSTGQVIQDADSARQKPQTGAVQPYKGKQQVREPNVLQKKKLSVMPRGQAAGRMQSQGAGSNRNKVQTQAVQPIKGKLQVQESKVLQKEKLSVTRRSPSAGQMQSQSVGKSKVQPQAAQQFKSKARIQDFRSPVGSSDPTIR